MERTLSKNEAKVILDLEWREQKTVTLAEMRAALDGSESYARFFAHKLVQKGWLERLRPGLFRLVPADRGREGVADANPLTAGAALVSPYFFSFGTACTHHGLTEQVFAEIYIACRRRRRPVLVRGKRYLFVGVSPARFFGFHELTVLGEPVQMATVERALLDAIDRPQHAGGLGEVSRIVARASTRVSWPALLALAHRWQVPAIVQRLGYLLDLHRADISDHVRTALLDLTRQAGKIHLGSRGTWGNAGKLARPWNVVENVPHDVLVSKTDQPRRRVVFHPKGLLRDRRQVRGPLRPQQRAAR
jgi:predicted transcriptional regulator of viral defense system